MGDAFPIICFQQKGSSWNRRRAAEPLTHPATCQMESEVPYEVSLLGVCVWPRGSSTAVSAKPTSKASRLGRVCLHTASRALSLFCQV